MDINHQTDHLTPQNGIKKRLKEQIKNIVVSQNLETRRRLVKAIAAELKISVLDCAAALSMLTDHASAEETLASPASVTLLPDARPSPIAQPIIRLVRYRLDLGNQHNLDITELKKVLVEESGVDIKNIANVRIQDTYTLIDLPDEMPQEIFHHLKSVEINGQKLDIRRVKPRNKKRNMRRFKPKKTGTQNTVLN